MLKKLLILFPWILLVLQTSYCSLAPHRGYIGPIALPAHDGFLPEEDVQWWYWTGHLKAKAEDGTVRQFGFEICIFAFDKFGIMKDILTQVAITDVADNSFHFKEYLEVLTLPDELKNRFQLTAGPSGQVRTTGGNGSDQLHLEIDDYVLDLEAKASAPPWLHYLGNPRPYRFGGFTYYYSRPNMATQGTLKIGETTYQIEGTTWFDRQYGELLQAIIQGWQWFAIQLESGEHIMLFDFLGKENRIERFGSVLDANGENHHLGPDDYTVEILGIWISPDTGCTYPSGWRITIGDMSLEVTPKVINQELHADHDIWIGPEYWEGASYVKGTHSGQAYVELNGFCRDIEGGIDL